MDNQTDCSQLCVVVVNPAEGLLEQVERMSLLAGELGQLGSLQITLGGQGARLVRQIRSSSREES